MTAEQKKFREWWIVDESTDPADKCDRWQYGRFNTEKYNQLPEQFQARVIDYEAYRIAVEALKIECGGRCAQQNPCAAREALEKLDEK